MEIFKLPEHQEYIELVKLLKHLGWIGTGGEGKMRIRDGEVIFNGTVELQVRKKLRSGDIVGFDGKEVRIG